MEREPNGWRSKINQRLAMTKRPSDPLTANFYNSTSFYLGGVELQIGARVRAIERARFARK